MTGLCNDVIGDHIVRTFERLSISEQETPAQGVEALVVDPIDHH